MDLRQIYEDCKKYIGKCNYGLDFDDVVLHEDPETGKWAIILTKNELPVIYMSLQTYLDLVYFADADD